MKQQLTDRLFVDPSQHLAGETLGVGTWYSHEIEAPGGFATEWAIWFGAVLGAPSTSSIAVSFEVWMPNIDPIADSDATGSWFGVVKDENPEMFGADASGAGGKAVLHFADPPAESRRRSHGRDESWLPDVHSLYQRTTGGLRCTT
jgi:hypothetical protein